MASCTKCGKAGIKRKLGLAKCKRCGTRGTVGGKSDRLLNTAKSDDLRAHPAAHEIKQRNINMAKLNQIIAIEAGIKSKAKAALDNIYKTIQRADMFSGLSKTYQPKEDGDEVLPPDNKKVQLVAPFVLANLELVLSEAMQVIARKDWTNQVATASVKIDEQIILPDVPVSYLLYLEKA